MIQAGNSAGKGANMWLPPYFGDYEQFVKALLHNPFLGSGHSGFGPNPRLAYTEPQPQPWLRATPDPNPWYRGTPDPPPWSVPFLFSAVSIKETASFMSNKEAAQQITAAADAAIASFLDDYCGTPPKAIPWPFPGPPPWVEPIASQLTAIANTLQQGALRTGLLQLAGQVLDKAFGGAGLRAVA